MLAGELAVKPQDKGAHHGKRAIIGEPISEAMRTGAERYYRDNTSLTVGVKYHAPLDAAPHPDMAYPLLMRWA
jgi:hypothetical protein